MLDVAGIAQAGWHVTIILGVLGALALGILGVMYTKNNRYKKIPKDRYRQFCLAL